MKLGAVRLIELIYDASESDYDTKSQISVATYIGNMLTARLKSAHNTEANI